MALCICVLDSRRHACIRSAFGCHRPYRNGRPFKAEIPAPVANATGGVSGTRARSWAGSTFYVKRPMRMAELWVALP